MEGTDRKNRIADPERKWIRLQEIGLCQFLAIPVMIMVIAVVSDGFIITGHRAAFFVNFIIIMSLFLVSIGGACFMTGYDKRCELRDQEDK